jgi:spermidine synthase
MYHVISVGITVVFLYFLSYLFYLNDFYSKAFHNKIWNFALAAAFILAALAGIFLALQVNYKWEIPFVKTILKWHVECGIGLAFTGLFHFIWHFSYFFKKAGKNIEGDIDIPTIPRSAKQNAINLYITGFTSTSVQLLMMREILNISGGYELVTGVFLASWLIGSAAGSYASGNSGIKDLKKLNIIFGLNILLSLILMLLLGRLYLNAGETPSFFISIIYTLIVLLPFTFVSGFTFMKILTISGKQYNVHSGISFSLETVGGVVSGIIISVFSYNLLDTYQLLLILCLLFFTYVTITFIYKKRSARILILTLMLIAIPLVIFLKPDRFFRELLLPGIKVISTTDTPYGNITRGEYGGEESLYYNHRLLRWQNDETEREEDVHYAMLQREDPGKVLVVSGNINSIMPELAKYHIKKVWYVERDPGLLKMRTGQQDQYNDQLKVINTDAYRFIRETNEKFDVILLILPPPSTLLLNRFYTTDFFLVLRERLNMGGVFMCSPGVGENYFNRESTVLYSSLYNSLASVFRFVIPIVGNKLYYIASDDSVSTGICSLTVKRGIKNTYVNSDFLSDDLISGKTSKFLKTIDRNAALNRLAVPAACFHFQTYNLSKTSQDAVPSVFLLAAIFILPLISVRRRNLMMYFSAGALAGFEIIVLIILQSTAGNIYQITGLIIAGLMTGLALGSGFKWISLSKHPLLINSFMLMIFYCIMALIVNKVLGIEIKTAGISLIVLSTMIPSFFTGQIFRSITGINGTASSPSVYSADLAGSAMAFIVISAFAVPLLGISNSLFLLSGLVFTGCLFGTIANK